MSLASMTPLPVGDDFAIVEAMARHPRVERAFEVIDQQAEWTTERQVEFTRIAAPTFGETRRAGYFHQQFKQMGLDRVRRDAAGNVLAEWAGASPIDGGRSAAARGRRVLVLSAHLDTVFPPGTRIEVRRESGRRGTGTNGGRIYAPGITDNGAGLAALLGVARAFRRSGLRAQDSMLFVANVCEEGEGNLYGMRSLLDSAELRKNIRCVMVLDGANTEHITAHALGSRRFLVKVEGQGGHSWSDFGMAHPVNALCAAVALFSATAVPSQPRTSFNIGQIQGGSSVNSIPASAWMKVDIRSSSASEMRRLSGALEKAARAGIEQEHGRARTGRLSLSIEDIGERPAADLPGDARILRIVQAVDEFLGIRSRVERSSTDANVPLALGIEAVSLGGGGHGGAAHSLQEWYDPTEREVGLKRILLALCAMGGLEA